MAPRIDQGTLEQYLKDNKLTIVERQPASMVPPIYRKKPKEEQVLTGVHGVEKILLSNEKSVFICIDCTNVFDTSNSTNAHRSRCQKVKDKKAVVKVEDLQKQFDTLTKAFKIRSEELQDQIKQNAKWEEAYGDLKRKHDVLQSNYELLWTANEALHRDMEKLKSDAGLSEGVKQQFVDAMAQAMEAFSEKWMKVTDLQKQVARDATDIINS
jgi:uncharacterized protein YhaN